MVRNKVVLIVVAVLLGILDVCLLRWKINRLFNG